MIGKGWFPEQTGGLDPYFCARSLGFHSADPLIALVYLRCAAITVELRR
jgi:hypothetical protein